ncbi:probable E3 SUMO-protein ligase RNF212 [Myotis myotis]|uniref:probable E3 SUMO-protein ligase RNF212 n=1 Tax=Myotis myotis TaxID=51298 RepID=UPI001748CBB0|nr:probable E3 SUMO-protein ligase RNF212 [Myotis myotis]
MAGWVFCNGCFQPPGRASHFSLTSCGHVYCDGCLSRGKEGECLICKVPCRAVFLSKHTDPGVQALFMGIDGLCRKYSKETSQISEFQEKHRKRLLAFYREKIARLEEALRKAMLRVEQLQSMRPSQPTAFSALRSPVSKPCGQLLRPPGSSASSERLEPMEVDLTPSPLRRPEPAGPTRVSLISPPQDGRMGSVSRLGPQQLSLTPGRTSGFQTLSCVGAPGRLDVPVEWAQWTRSPRNSTGVSGPGNVMLSDLAEPQEGPRDCCLSVQGANLRHRGRAAALWRWSRGRKPSDPVLLRELADASSLVPQVTHQGPDVARDVAASPCPSGHTPATCTTRERAPGEDPPASTEPG